MAAFGPSPVNAVTKVNSSALNENKEHSKVASQPQLVEYVLLQVLPGKT